MVENPSLGIYLVDKQYKNTIYKINRIAHYDSWDRDTLYEVVIVEGKDDHGSGTWFSAQELNEYFFEVEFNATTRTLYGTLR